MNGQWIGSFSGTSTGRLVADLDDHKDLSGGVVCVYQDQLALVRSVAHVTIPKGQRNFSARVRIDPQERGSGKFLTPDELKSKYPDLVMPTYADAHWVISDSTIGLDWTTDIGTNGSATLAMSEADKRSVLTANAVVQSWEDFKRHALSLETRRYIFRGHERNDWRLRTSFHRTGRASLSGSCPKTLWRYIAI